MSWRAMRVIYTRDGNTRPPGTRARRLNMPRSTKLKLVKFLMERLTAEQRLTFDVEDFRDACDAVLRIKPGTREELIESRMHRRLGIMCGKHQQQAGRWFIHLGLNEYRLSDFAIEAAAKGPERTARDIFRRGDYVRMRREVKRLRRWTGQGMGSLPPEAWDIVLGRFWARFPFGGTIDDLIAVIEETNADKESGMKVSANKTAVRARLSQLATEEPPRVEVLERGVYRAVIPHVSALLTAAEPRRGRVSERAWIAVRGKYRLTDARSRMRDMTSVRLLEEAGVQFRLPETIRAALRNPYERAALLVMESASSAEEEGDPTDPFEQAALLVMEDASRAPEE